MLDKHWRPRNKQSRYDDRLHQEEAFGDVDLKVSLENQIADETRHKEELESVLVG